jgi:transposase
LERVYREHIDFRKQLNGLVQLVVSEKKSQPNDGAVYVFRNRQRNKVKLLLWHRNGFFLGYKRLERGKFDFPIDSDVVEVDAEALRELVLGMPMVYAGKGQAEKVVFS